MAKVLMIQGTMSNVGKSWIVAGLCRIFKQDGYKVAPFKSQNMALNSFITEEGLEIGRAQAMQAEAAGIEPDARMNPILLKPTDDTGSQVIINGEVWGNMSAAEYTNRRSSFITCVIKAFDSLCNENDIVIMEGAGSPAEINLKENDIANMGMAAAVGSPVLLVGDIDRGGVFAQLIGTVSLLDDRERDMIKGLIINKFRGDRSILDPGVDIIEKRTDIPVLGVTPYLDIDIDDEDSLSERLSSGDKADVIDIAVIRLPRISNFTDLNAMDTIPGVSVRYCKNASEIKDPDMIVIPGSKNTISDLLWMRENGIEAAILKYAAAGGVIWGICGGYQMLGETLTDPLGVEASKKVRGMGLLPVDTVFENDKERTRVSGTFTLKGSIFDDLTQNGVHIDGYEIHMGQSTLREGASHMAYITDSITGGSKADGAYKGGVFGSYIHGIFDGDGIGQAIVDSLAEKKGVKTGGISTISYKEHKEAQYDMLAAALRKSLDIDKIYQILDESER